MDCKFIQALDESTSKKLTQLGFQKIQSSDGMRIFLNTDKLVFSEDVDKTKLRYTNMLYI